MQKPARLARVEEAIARAAGVTVERLNGQTRDRTSADARAAVWWIAYDHMHYTFPMIGKLYGRDHTTVMSAVKRMRSKKASEKILEGVKKVCPEVLEGLPGPDEPRSVENWQFEK